MEKLLCAMLLLLSFAASAVSAEPASAWGGSAYLLSGWDSRSLTYTSPSQVATSIDASGFIIETGGSVRWTPFSFVAVEVTGGLDWYLAAQGAVDAMGVAGYGSSASDYYTGAEYSDGDNIATFIAGDLYFFVPYLPINLFVGYKLSLFVTDLMSDIEGPSAARIGVEIPITSAVSLRVIGEMPFASGAKYTFSDNATVSSATGYCVQAEAVFAF